MSYTLRTKKVNDIETLCRSMGYVYLVCFQTKQRKNLIYYQTNTTKQIDVY